MLAGGHPALPCPDSGHARTSRGMEEERVAREGPHTP
jgi:hypothetical protein